MGNATKVFLVITVCGILLWLIEPILIFSICAVWVGSLMYMIPEQLDKHGFFDKDLDD